MATIEHVNITVSDPDRTASMLDSIFGWKIRWQGVSELGGRSVHVGLPENGDSYLALYSHNPSPSSGGESYGTTGGLNHIGITVDDLDAVEERVREAGLHSHPQEVYKPGRRFYFEDHDGIEFEVVSYQ